MTPLPMPSVDIAQLNDRLGRAWGVSCGESIPQYLAWAETAGIFSLVAARDYVTWDDFRSCTILGDYGVDALVPILNSLGLLHRDDNSHYRLSTLAREYLLKESRYYVGAGLFWDCQKPIPTAFLRQHVEMSDTTNEEAKARWPGNRLRVPHSRNFAPSVVAARTGEFDSVEHLVDIGGGSGVLAIPLALDCPRMRITLVELPSVVGSVREILAQYGVEQRVEVIGMNAFADDWAFAPCDGIFFGNIFHGNNDDACRFLCRKSIETLSALGKIWIHEVVFNENKDGPLVAALWNANVIVRKPGARQRTASELTSMLQHAGFEKCYTLPTAGGFSLVTATKPNSSLENGNG